MELPLDLLAKAFSYLDIRSLMVATRVSRTWNALSHENFLWRDLIKRRWLRFPSAIPEARQYYITRVCNQKHVRELLRCMCLGAREAEKNEMAILGFGEEMEEFIKYLSVEGIDNDLTVTHYAKEMLHSFRLSWALRAWTELLLKPLDQQRVEDGAILMARSISISLSDPATVYAKLDSIAEEVLHRLTPEVQHFERMNVVRQVLFDEMQFAGDSTHYYNPKNCMIDVALLERRKANPITLCAIFTAVCRRVGIAIDLMGTPGHFMTRYTEPSGQAHYIDCFSGEDLTRDELIVRLGGASNVDEPVSLVLTWMRMLHNVVTIYSALPFGRDEEFAAVAQLALIRGGDLDRIRFCEFLFNRQRYERLQEYLKQWRPRNPLHVVEVYNRLLARLVSLQQEEANGGQTVQHRSAAMNPLFRVGQVVAYKGKPHVIIRWRPANGVPEYGLLGIFASVQQASLRLIDDSEAISPEHPIHTQKADLGCYFSRLENGRFVMNEGLRKEYPNDD